MDWKVCVVPSAEGFAFVSQVSNALLYGAQIKLILPTMSVEPCKTDPDFYVIGESNFKNAQDTCSAFNSQIEFLHPETGDEFTLKEGQKANEVAEKYFSDLQDIISHTVSSCHASFIFAEQYKVRSPTSWKSHQAAQELMNAIQRVLLPDVSELTLEQIKALQDRSKDELDPMRAEMLRLTEDLRKMVGDDWDTNDLAREAENLIATRVEPSVRELNSRIKSDVKTTGIGYGGQLLKSIGLLTFGRLFQNEKTVEKAFTEATDFLGDKVTGLSTPKADTAASRYVIEIQQGIEKMA
ncbi:MAG: hypothetical protein AAF950_17770 [Pseudomonadota bacterium]